MSEQLYDAPNQQSVRADGSGPGIGGAEEVAGTAASSSSLDEMTKAELLEYAQGLGISPANNAMSKEELRDAIDAHEALS